MALRRVGIDSVVLERNTSAALGVGSFLTLGSNGLVALEALGVQGDALGFETRRIDLLSGTGKALGSAGISGPTEMPASRTMKRATLYAAVRQEAVARGITIRAGAEVVDAEERPDRVTAVLGDGTRLSADLLIGCDGIWSRTRSIIDTTAPAPTYTGLIGHGGYAPPGVVTDHPGTYRMIFGRRAFFGYVVAPDGEAWWFLNEPQPRPDTGRWSGDQPRDANQLRAVLIDLMRGDRGPAIELLQATQEFAPSGPIHSVPRLPHWHSSRMVVIGDAAHAPSPSSGQGASLALEDAVVLARRLRDHASLETALAAFTAQRRPRVESIIKQAARVNSSKAATGVARVVRDAILPVLLRATAASPQLRDTYDYRVEALDPR